MAVKDDIEESRKELQALIPAPDPGKVTRRVKNAQQLQKLKQELTAENATELLPKLFAYLSKGVETGNKHACDMVAELYGLVQSKGGPMVNVVQQNNQVNVSGGSKKDRNYESIIRRLEEREYAKHEGSPILDAEFTDSPEGDAG